MLNYYGLLTILTVHSTVAFRALAVIPIRIRTQELASSTVLAWVAVAVVDDCRREIYFDDNTD